MCDIGATVDHSIVSQRQYLSCFFCFRVCLSFEQTLNRLGDGVSLGEAPWSMSWWQNNTWEQDKIICSFYRHFTGKLIVFVFVNFSSTNFLQKAENWNEGRKRFVGHFFSTSAACLFCQGQLSLKRSFFFLP